MAKIKVEIDADLQDLIPQFLENRKKDIASLQELIAKQDLTAIAQLAHKIKGAAAGYGFVDLSNMASDMEKAAKNNDGTPLPIIASNMKNHFDNIEIHFVPM
ncbi:Hpt domain-containing protein [Bdellovibrio svalbardensis]|uniref:Hpt domain-containing protein n=1 Tax=Bdellovibrio svalbardensis TaxID=2972972 RepID=A0ABT6DKS2_9BACT|nr:Hpt domain-containing protein [Bdellovibrio svalbardensis]MDG0817251.1 Hpt domain-containing protein [Bdellovibrio svalbardensis]